VPATVFFGLMNYTYLTAMAEGTAANAIWLQSTAPVWVLLVGVLVFGEKSQWEDWLLVLLSAVGVGIILWFEARGQSLRSVLWGLAAGLFYGGVVLSLRHLRGMDSAWLVALNHVVTVGMLAPAALAGVAWKSDSAGYWPQGIQWGLLAAFGILQMGLPYMLFARGLRHIPGHEATGVGLLEPILMPLWVYLAWHLAPAWWTMAGAGFILLGLAVRYLAPGRTQSLSELPEPPEAPPIPLDGPSPSEASLK
jgi:drug/metabolite transporter (DMT)-like permease